MTKKRVNGRFIAEGDGPAEEKTPAKKRRAAVPQVRHCRTYTRRRVAEALPEIVEKFLKEAKEGSVPHAKALASLGGLDKGDVVAKVKPRHKSFAGLLLEELDKPAKV